MLVDNRWHFRFIKTISLGSWWHFLKCLWYLRIQSQSKNTSKTPKCKKKKLKMFYLDNIYQQRDIKKSKSSLPTSISRSMTKEPSTTKGPGFRTRKGFCLAEAVNMGGDYVKLCHLRNPGAPGASGKHFYTVD